MDCGRIGNGVGGSGEQVGEGDGGANAFGKEADGEVKGAGDGCKDGAEQSLEISCLHRVTDSSGRPGCLECPEVAQGGVANLASLSE
jgi:hypothetical protein